MQCCPRVYEASLNMSSILDGTTKVRERRNAIFYSAEYVIYFNYFSIVGYIHRVSFDTSWRCGICKGEKMSRALAVWLPYIQGDQSTKLELLRDILQYIFCSWGEKTGNTKNRRSVHTVVSGEKMPHQCYDGDKCPLYGNL